MLDKKVYLIAALTFFSGFTSLVYESIWIRVISLGVGSTSAAMGLILGIFFGGLALGSYLSGRYLLGRIANPIRAYGFVEGLIGLYACFVIFSLFHFHEILGFFIRLGLGEFPALVLLLKAIFVAAFLGPPSLGMGATLPILIEATKGIGSKGVGFFYGVNTLGAVFGSALTGAILIPQFGILGANAFAVALNFLILVVACFGFQTVKISKAAIQSLDQSTENKLPLAGRPGKSVLALGALTGFVSVGAEVVWNKYLNIFFGSNIFGIGILLTVFLVGIAIGSLAIARMSFGAVNLDKLIQRLLGFAFLSLIFSSAVLDQAPLLAAAVHGLYLKMIPFLWVKAFVVALILLPTTFCFGAIFPILVSKLDLARASLGLARATGDLYAINTLGSISASLLIGLWFLPELGSRTTMTVLVSLLGLGYLMCARKRLSIAYSVGTFLFVGLGGYATFQSVGFSNIIKSAYYQPPTEKTNLLEILGVFLGNKEEFKFLVEGETAVISLSNDPSDGENYQAITRLKTNGLNESYYESERKGALPKYEALLGLLPYSFVRDPHRAFVVGYGGGYTVDFLTGTDLKRVHVAELEKGILDAADFIYDGKNPILGRSNLKLQVEDARFVLATKTAEPFDIIVSQPSHSWLTGVANLFTQEFFELVKANLTEKGMFSQWLNLYNMDDTVLKSILKTFYSVFPHGAVFTNLDDRELIMLGSQLPLKFNLEKLKRMTSNKNLIQQMQQVGFSNSYEFLTNFALSRNDVLALTKDATINTDRNAFAEVNQSRLFYEKHRLTLSPQSFLIRGYSADLLDYVFPRLDSSSKSEGEFFSNLLKAQKDTRKFSKAFVVFSRLEAAWKDDPSKYPEIAATCLSLERYECAIRYSKRFSEGLSTRVLAYKGLGQYQEILNEVKAERVVSLSTPVKCQTFEAALVLNDSQTSTRFYRLLGGEIGIRGNCPENSSRLAGMWALMRGDYKIARRELEGHYRHQGRDVLNVTDLATIYRKTGNEKSFGEFSVFANKLADEELRRLNEMSTYLREKELLADSKMILKRGENLLRSVKSRSL